MSWYPMAVLAAILTAALVAVGVLSATHRPSINKYRHAQLVDLSKVCGPGWVVQDAVGVTDDGGDRLLPGVLRVTCATVETGPGPGGFPRAVRTVVVRAS